MAITSVSNDVTSQAAPFPGAASDRASFRSAFRTLTQSIQSGDLGAAQQAFAALQNFAGAAGGSTATPGASTPVAGGLSADLQAVGNALQSGDVHAAQDALAKLRQDAQAVGGAHHHHGHRHAPSSPAATNASTASAADAFAATPGSIDVTA